MESQWKRKIPGRESLKNHFGIIKNGSEGIADSLLCDIYVLFNILTYMTIIITVPVQTYKGTIVIQIV